MSLQVNDSAYITGNLNINGNMNVNSSVNLVNNNNINISNNGTVNLNGNIYNTGNAFIDSNIYIYGSSWQVSSTNIKINLGWEVGNLNGFSFVIKTPYSAFGSVAIPSVYIVKFIVNDYGDSWYGYISHYNNSYGGISGNNHPIFYYPGVTLNITKIEDNVIPGMANVTWTFSGGIVGLNNYDKIYYRALI